MGWFGTRGATRWVACGLAGLGLGFIAESRAACDANSPTRMALFGDLHIHTGLSFDAFISSIRLGPEDAYRYAKGEAIRLPGADGQPADEVAIDRPLDFAAVTDHGEFLGQVSVCAAETGVARYWPL